MSSLGIPANAMSNPVNAMADVTEGTKPWMNTQLPAKERTELLLDKMTMEQKIQQIATSRFNENDTGKTVVIDNLIKQPSTGTANSRPRVPCLGVNFRTLAVKSVGSMSWAFPLSA